MFNRGLQFDDSPDGRARFRDVFERTLTEALGGDEIRKAIEDHYTTGKSIRAIAREMGVGRRWLQIRVNEGAAKLKRHKIFPAAWKRKPHWQQCWRAENGGTKDGQ